MRIRRSALHGRFFLLLFLFGSTIHGVRAQYAGLYSWNHITLAGKITKTLDIRLSEELRFDDPFSHLSDYFTEAVLKFSPFKFLDLDFAYRNIRDHQKDGSWEKLNRLHASAEAGKEFGRLTPAYRLRWQNYPEAWNNDKTGHFYLRHRFSLTWDIPNCKVNPEFAAELFHRFNNDNTNELATLRLTLKSYYKFSGRSRILFGLRKQYEYDEKTPENAWILDLGYRYDLF